RIERSNIRPLGQRSAWDTRQQAGMALHVSAKVTFKLSHQTYCVWLHDLVKAIHAQRFVDNIPLSKSGNEVLHSNWRLTRYNVIGQSSDVTFWGFNCRRLIRATNINGVTSF